MLIVSTMGNAHSDFVRDTVLAAMRNDNWKPLLASVRDTWPSMVSPSTAIRDSLHWSGFRSLEFVLLQLFSERPSGLLPKNYETVKECLMNKHVLTEFVKKLKLPNGEPVVPEGSSAKDAFLIFVGGLRRDCGDLGKALAWLRNLFTPLMQIAENAFTLFEDKATAKAAKRRRIENTEANYPRKSTRENEVLKRLRLLRSARELGEDHQSESRFGPQLILAHQGHNGASTSGISSRGMGSLLPELFVHKPQQGPAFCSREDRLSLAPSRRPLTPRNHEVSGRPATSSLACRPLVSANFPTGWRTAQSASAISACGLGTSSLTSRPGLQDKENVHAHCG